MGLKKVLNVVFSFVGLAAIGLCAGIAIKSPDTYENLFGINKNDENKTIAGVPYYCNFGDLGTSDSSYKTQYFKYANKSWYLSWGNFGSTNHTNENDNFNMLLGWNDTKLPSYGGYSYTNEVMKKIKVTEEQNYTYILMDFDFKLNHNMEWSFSSLDGSKSDNTFIYLICSHDSGSSWNILSTKNGDKLVKDEMITLNNVEESLTSRTTRYGLVLVSDIKSAIRLELNQFVVSRLSVS